MMALWALVLGFAVSPAESMVSFSKYADDFAVQPSAGCGERCSKLRTEFRYIVHVGKEIYCYWDLKKAETHVDYDALVLQLEGMISNSTTSSQYYRILRQWAASFHDGHVNVLTTSDMTGLEVYTSPLRLEVLAPATDHEKLIVVKIGAGVDSAEVGDEVKAINGVDAKTAVSDFVSTSRSGSTERMRRFFGGRQVLDRIGSDQGTQPLVLNLLSQKGESKTIEVPRTIEVSTKPYPKQSGGIPFTGAENVAASVLQGGIGYLRIDGFSGDQDEFLFDQLMDRLALTNGLILDLRKNGGGDLSGDRILARLTKKEIIRYKRREKMSDFLLAYRPDTYLVPHLPGAAFADWHDLNVKPNRDQPYSKPVVALISPNCFSACDTFSASLKSNGLATFLGEGTGGGTGTPLVFDLPVSNLQFRYSVIQGRAPNGQIIEGQGTQPDIYLEPTLEDRIKQKDSQLLRAMQMLNPGQTALSTDSVPYIAEQDLRISPTRVDAMELERIQARDER